MIWKLKRVVPGSRGNEGAYDVEIIALSCGRPLTVVVRCEGITLSEFGKWHRPVWLLKWMASYRSFHGVLPTFKFTGLVRGVLG